MNLSKLKEGRIIMKMLLLLLYAVALVLGVAEIARAIPIEFTDVWYPTALEPATILKLLGCGLIGIAEFSRRKFRFPPSRSKKHPDP
jgi:hypothetical protein